jgi:hypothetical protein
MVIGPPGIRSALMIRVCPTRASLGQDLADGRILRDKGDAPVADAELDPGKRRSLSPGEPERSQRSFRCA